MVGKGFLEGGSRSSIIILKRLSNPMAKCLKILFCNYEYPPIGGGGGVINAQIAQELAKVHEVTVLTSQGFNLPLESNENRVRVVRAPVYFRRKERAANMISMAAFLPAGVHRGLKLLKETRFDVINTHFVLPTGPVGDIMSHKAKIPNVLSLHGGDLFDPSKWTSPHRNFLLRFWIKKLLRSADTVVGQSSNTLENMRRYYTPEIKGIQIPLGILRPKTEAASRRAFGIDEDEMVLVTVGRVI